MLDTIDFVDEALFESEAEREEREVAMWDGPSDEDWAWYFEATYVDPAEREF